MRSWLSHPACLVAAGILSVLSASSLHAQAFQAQRLDVGKGRIEFPAKSILAGANPFNAPAAFPNQPNGIPFPNPAAQGVPPGLADRGKGTIELPARSILAGLKKGQPSAPQPAPPVPAPVDVGKRKIERPAKTILADAPAQPNAPVPVRADVGKGFIEGPAKYILASNPPAPAQPAIDDNPTVEPGKVRWHATLEEAKKASLKSGKPVLLFQMMGKLDKKFC